MAYQQKPNTGALFKNDRKKSANHPDYKGKLNVEGQAFHLAGWIKTRASGGQFLSLAITADERGEAHVSDEDAAGHGWGV